MGDVLSQALILIHVSKVYLEIKVYSLGLQPIWEFLKTIETRKNSKTNFQLMTRFVVEQLLAGTTLYWKVFKPFCKG